ncbi:TlpA family protein disulfide reductase [Chitinophaga eiseniae]|uniref:TlpA family protein disulfide reductase n=1 Tax=Chitinophaga eiseniae TaxID=634771 RepID=A0A847SQF4_9BACT|nr:TlpA disulfide reductase family protein [Chitinophaga eiseniae]NLR78302.1 TlpA family protein disulfide reductase [Chitinophaga eiseniae]
MRYSLFLVVFLAMTTHSFARQWDAPDPVAVLIQLADKLSNVQRVSYHYERILSYSSEKYYAAMSGKVWLDFASGDTVLGCRYQVDNDALTDIYNGAEKFTLDKTRKTMRVKSHPVFTDFAAASFFYNSILTLKRAMPNLLQDKNIDKNVKDTVFQHKEYYLVTCWMHKQVIDYLGALKPITQERKTGYKILISKKTGWARRITEINNVNDDYTQTDFTDIEDKPTQPDQNSWYYSTYAPVYKLAADRPLIPLALNTMAPAWQLPVWGTKDSLSLSQLKGHPVMLEFWIRNCGYCLAAVPEINTFSKTYKDLQIVGVNVNDRPADITAFCEVTHPAYPIVHQGQEVAAQYGIDLFPTVVLLDAQGKVIYTGAFNEQRIGALLRSPSPENK